MSGWSRSTMKVYFTGKGGTGIAVQERLNAGRQAIRRQRKIWNSRQLALAVKLRVLKTVVLPVVVYGAESWVMGRREENKLMVFESKNRRKVLRIGWRDRVRNEEVRRRAGLTTNIMEKSRDIQRRWFGHVERI